MGLLLVREGGWLEVDWDGRVVFLDFILFGLMIPGAFLFRSCWALLMV
jgi:hypothetical protein